MECNKIILFVAPDQAILPGQYVVTLFLHERIACEKAAFICLLPPIVIFFERTSLMEFWSYRVLRVFNYKLK
jgi:hypothetical protein